MKIVTALLLASALMIAGQAAAQSTEATLQDLSGKVLMNKGDGLVSGKAGAALVDGDRIVTLDKSGARIVFPGRLRCHARRKHDFRHQLAVGMQGRTGGHQSASGPGADDSHPGTDSRYGIRGRRRPDRQLDLQ